MSPRRLAAAEAAFTLLELLTALVIVAALAALLTGSFKSIHASGKQAECLANLKQLGAIGLSYSTDHNGEMLPALANFNGSSGTPWYSILDSTGLLRGKPTAPNTWNKQTHSVMTCPSRDDVPVPLWNGVSGSGNATLHYGLSELPGFINYTGTPGTAAGTLYGGSHKLANIVNPSRTMMFGEITQNYKMSANNPLTCSYPHPSNGDGQNIVFWDGHAIYFKGPLPAVVPERGSLLSFKASDWTPDASYPWF